MNDHINQARPLRAAMSVDVEDWFQVQNLAGAIPRSEWDAQECRVVANTRRMLEMMAKSRVRSTCFVLGWVAERNPQLVRDIVAAGHELASHGHGHELVYEIGAERFREDVRRSKRILEDIAGVRVTGYRAPNFSITDWAIDVLAEEGYLYDSSSFPVVGHDRYGRLSKGGAGKAVYEIAPSFHEVCVSSLPLLGRNIPWGGGGWFRLFPYALFRVGVDRILASGQPFVFYLHPWEIDPDQPRVKCHRRSHAWRHYINLDRCAARWERLLADMNWVAITDLLTPVGN